MLRLKVHRFQTTNQCTKGILSINGKAQCFTLEDTYHAEKIANETRIPSGLYEIVLRTEGGMNERYKAKFGEVHKGMLHIKNVPDFEYIYLHYGNDMDDTSGCILCGSTLDINQDFTGNSVNAYSDMYKIVSKELVEGRIVVIRVINE